MSPMAIAPTCFKMPIKDCSHGGQYVARPSERCYQSDHLIILQGSRGIRSILNSDNLSRRRGKDASFFCQAVKKEGQIRALESYFSKLKDDGEDLQFRVDSSQKDEVLSPSNQFESERGLNSLKAYLDKVKGDMNPENCVLPDTKEMVTKGGKSMEKPVSVASGKFAIFSEKRSSQLYDVPKTSQEQHQFDGTSDLYIINIIASLNIAVFLFEIATPIRNSELELLSIPFLYGAKANQLIVIGEWWRLITPMFLHSGFLHVALGCWALASFGPKVCKGYGSFTFLLIYLLGGISGNLISFLHTPELTVGGTGPTFAMIGAWLIYQIQSKDVIAKENADSMFQKAIITTALGFLLSIDGSLIDDWTHFGAAITGITYGFLTCPILQMDDASTKEEGIMMVRPYADPCKSVLVFSLFILVLGSLVLFIEPPLNYSTVLEKFV